MAAINTGSFNSQLGQQQFLQLMAAQLANQNPLEPIQQQDFLSQLAQFSTLGGVESLNQNFSALFQLQKLTEGSNLIGKTAKYMNSSDQMTSGVVESAGISNGSLMLTIDGQQVDISDVLSVQNTVAAAG
jgi:flagellar basal-body rod modification protein FlgD